MNKKLLIGFTITGAVFGGFLLAQTIIGGSAKSNDTTNTTNSNTTTQAYITEAEAEHIALKLYNGTITEMDFDSDDRVPHYDFEIRNNKEEVDIEVNAETGEAVITSRSIDDDDDTNENNTGAATNTKSTTYITAAEAKKIALKLYNGTVVETDFDSDDRTPHYEFEIRNNNEEVDIEVNAETGKAVITSRSIDDDDDDNNTAAKTSKKTTTATANTNEKKTMITKAEAIKIASTVAKGTVTNVELDHDDDTNTYKYELEFKDGNVEYDVEINAYTGKIIEVDQDIDD